MMFGRKRSETKKEYSDVTVVKNIRIKAFVSM